LWYAAVIVSNGSAILNSCYNFREYDCDSFVDRKSLAGIHTTVEAVHVHTMEAYRGIEF